MNQQQQYYPPPQQQQQYYPPPQQYNQQQPQQPYYPPPQQQYNQQPQQPYYPPPQQYNQPQQQQQQQQYYPPQQQQYNQPPPQQQYYPPQQQPQFYQVQPHQQQQYYAQQPTFNPVTITPTFDPQHARVLAKPLGSEFIYNDGKSGIVELQIISAHNLMPADLNGLSDPFCKIRAFSIENLTTPIREETLSPQWNETFTITCNDVGVEILVIEVIDYDLIGKNDSLGYVAIDLSKLPKGIEIATKEHLQDAKHGTIEIKIKALNFGYVNFPPTYPLEYVKYRQEILLGKTREQIQKHISEFKKEMKKSIAKPNEGPYVGLLPPPGFNVKYGWITKDKGTSNSKSSNSEHKSSKPRKYDSLNNSGSKKKNDSSVDSICDAIGAVSDALSFFSGDDS